MHIIWAYGDEHHIADKFDNKTVMKMQSPAYELLLALNDDEWKDILHLFGILFVGI